MELISKIAFGGGCHWCAEAVFQSLNGVEKVEQGYVSSIAENSSF
jgi:peptide-methionine (S)-S-oxide reductase